MSASREEYPSCPLPLLPGEVVRARAEDPEFVHVLGRARAKARRVEYNPEIHHPYAPQAARHERVTPEHLEQLYELIDRFMDRGRKGGRHLRALPQRPGLEKVRNL